MREKKTKRRILAIDDDEVMLEGIKIALEEEGFAVFTTTDNLDIFKYLVRYRPELLLLDYRMPGIDGAQITKAVKSNDKWKNIPIIMFSASKGAEVVAWKSGADDFLEKPFELDELISKIFTFFP